MVQPPDQAVDTDSQWAVTKIQQQIARYRGIGEVGCRCGGSCRRRQNRLHAPCSAHPLRAWRIAMPHVQDHHLDLAYCGFYNLEQTQRRPSLMVEAARVWRTF